MSDLKLDDCPEALRDAYGTPSGALAFDTHMGRMPAWVFSHEGSFVLATSQLAALIGTEMSLRVPRTDQARVPDEQDARRLQALVDNYVRNGSRPEHGDFVPLVDPGRGLRDTYLLVRDPEMVHPGWIRAVRITDEEFDVGQTMSIKGLVIGLVEVLPGLISDSERGTALDDARIDALQATHPPPTEETSTASRLLWREGDRPQLWIDESCLPHLMRLADGVRETITLRWEGEQVVLTWGQTAWEREGSTVHITLSRRDILALTAHKKLILDDLVVHLLATDVTPAPAPQELVRHPPTRERPRLVHHLFTTRTVPEHARTLLQELQTGFATAHLRSLWAELNQLMQHAELSGIAPEFLEDGGRDPIAGSAFARIPGTTEEAVVGLGVVDVADRLGWRTVVVQLPPAQGPTEAHYVALAGKGDAVRIFTWEMTADGLAVLGEFWIDPASGQVQREFMDKQTSAHWRAFVQMLELWLRQHPRAPGQPSTRSPHARPSGGSRGSPAAPSADAPASAVGPARLIGWGVGLLALAAAGAGGFGVALWSSRDLQLLVYGEDDRMQLPASALAELLPAGPDALEPATLARWGKVATRQYESVAWVHEGRVRKANVLDLSPAWVVPKVKGRAIVALGERGLRKEGGTWQLERPTSHVGPDVLTRVQSGATGLIGSEPELSCSLRDGGAVDCTYRRRTFQAEGRFAHLVSNGRFVCALRTDGMAACWGPKRNDGPFSSFDEPRPIVSDMNPMRDLVFLHPGFCSLSLDGREVQCRGTSQGAWTHALPEPAESLAWSKVHVGNRLGVWAFTADGQPLQATPGRPEAPPITTQDPLRACLCSTGEAACAEWDAIVAQTEPHDDLLDAILALPERAAAVREHIQGLEVDPALCDPLAEPSGMK